MLLCLVAAACLYLNPLAQLVGRRPLVAGVHRWSGILLPVPLLLGLLSPEFRADLRRLNRFAVYDRRWLRAVRRGLTKPKDRPAGKFNAGQKLYAGWIAGAVLVMMFTGLPMWFMGFLPFLSRAGAIFVHDILAWVIALVLVGHLRKAYADPEARRGMRTGYVTRPWADRQPSPVAGRGTRRRAGRPIRQEQARVPHEGCPGADVRKRMVRASAHHRLTHSSTGARRALPGPPSTHPYSTHPWQPS